MRKALIILLPCLAVALLITLMLGLCAGPPSYYTDKYAGVDGLTRPAALPGDYTPERQTEGHTCGVHALRSIYAAYALDPDAADLRFRLGTDKPLTNFTPDLVGTIHPDIIRVLQQDGFQAQIVMMNDDAPERLKRHLRSGHPVLALVDVGGLLHWLVLARLDGTDVLIIDSLAAEAYTHDIDAYIRQRVLNAIVISPKP